MRSLWAVPVQQTSSRAAQNRWNCAADLSWAAPHKSSGTVQQTSFDPLRATKKTGDLILAARRRTNQEEQCSRPHLSCTAPHKSSGTVQQISFEPRRAACYSRPQRSYAVLCSRKCTADTSDQCCSVEENLSNKPQLSIAVLHAQANVNSSSSTKIFICLIPKAHSHRLNIEIYLRSLFGLHAYSCTHWLRPRNSSIVLIYEGAIGQPR